MDEIQNGAVTKSYSYGLERISQNWQPTTGNWQRAFYGYDGHGSVRFLTSSAGTVTDTYDYDAFGNLTNQTGTPPNNYLFAGEQFDPALNLYYNRARYLNTSTGRFWSMDSYEGDDDDPLSLHRYLYAGANPISYSDHTGHDFDLGSTLAASAGYTTIFGLSTVQSAVLINGVVGALIASSTAGIGAYLEGQSPDQIESATGSLYNMAVGALIGIAGGYAGAYRVGRFVMTALAIGGGGYQANREYRAGHTGAAFYYATLSLLAAGLINLVPYLAKEAGPLGAAETPTATTNTPQGRIGLWRGVPPTSPGYSNALNGIADPIGGTATPAEHINGNTNSSFTSWTSDPSVAARFAGENGVVMFKVFNSSDLIDSTQVPETNMDQWEPESEYLVTGRVSGATVVKR